MSKKWAVVTRNNTTGAEVTFIESKTDWAAEIFATAANLSHARLGRDHTTFVRKIRK